MPLIPMYLQYEDVEFLKDWLNQEEEIAYLVSNGHKRWIAKKEYDILTDIGTQQIIPSYETTIPDHVEYNLWHIPSGPLPLLEPISGGVSLKLSKEDWIPENIVGNPWLGWNELRTGQNFRVPYFASHPGVFHLEVTLLRYSVIPQSKFQWIGNRYREIGNVPNQSTEQFWKRLKRMVRKVATHIPVSNNPNGKKEIYAFPAAYKAIRNGKPCS